MLNLTYQGCIEHRFWGDYCKFYSNLWDMKDTKDWKEDFLSTTTNESPMPIGIEAPPPAAGSSNLMSLLGVGN